MRHERRASFQNGAVNKLLPSLFIVRASLCSVTSTPSRAISGDLNKHPRRARLQTSSCAGGHATTDSAVVLGHRPSTRLPKLLVPVLGPVLGPVPGPVPVLPSLRRVPSALDIISLELFIHASFRRHSEKIARVRAHVAMEWLGELLVVNLTVRWTLRVISQPDRSVRPKKDIPDGKRPRHKGKKQCFAIVLAGDGYGGRFETFIC